MGVKIPKGKIINRVKELRKSKTDMTQIDLGKAVGATRQTIIAIEAGKYAPSMELAFKMAIALDETFETVFQFDPKGT